MRPVFEVLEERILYSADFAPSLAANLPQLSEAQVLTVPAQTAVTHEIVFADASLADLGQLRQDLDAQRAAGRSVDLVVVGADEDGISVITRTLAQSQGVTAIHLIGHGAAGTLELGSNAIDAGALLGRAEDIASWGRALTGDADILIYGCDFAGTPTGAQIVDGIAALTGADVAASNDTTGGEARGGDWLLEVRSGAIEAALAPSRDEQLAWSEALGLMPGSTGTAIFGEHNFPAPQTSAWDGLSFGAQDTSSNLGQWLMMTGAQAPTRNESIVVGVSVDGSIRGAMSSGGNWAALPLNPLGTSGVVDRAGFAVAYEQQSGDAILVWDASGTLKYSTWNGTTWSAAAVVAGYTGAAPGQLQLVAQPGGDGMMLAVSDVNSDFHGLVWNGSAWGNAITLDSSASAIADQTALAVAYESQSGDAIVAYARAGSADVFYRSWNGSAWSSQSSFTAPAGVTTRPQWLRLATDPLTDRIGLGVSAAASSGSSPIWFGVWDGNAFGSRILADTRGNVGGPGVAVGFESRTGELLAAFGINDNKLRSMTWSATGGWSAVLTGPDLGAKPTALTLAADPNSSQLMLSAQLDNDRLKLLAWDGSSWGASKELSSDTDSRYGQASVFLFRLDAEEYSGNALWLSPKDNVPSGWRGVNSIDGDGVVSLGGSDLTLGVNNTSGNFSHVFTLEGFGTHDPQLQDLIVVSRNLTFAGSIGLQAGDVIFDIGKDNVTLASLNSVNADRADLILFRPQSAGDYSSGTFTIIASDMGALVPGFAFNDLRGIALVETDTVVGNVTLAAGTILFSREGGAHDKNVYAFSPGAAVGGKVTSGTVTTLLNGAEIGINEQIRGIEIVSSPAQIGGVTLPGGALLLTLDKEDVVGGNNLSTVKGDVFYLQLTQTSIGGTAAGSATLLVQATSLGMNPNVVDGLALRLMTNAAPVISSDGGGDSAAVSVGEGSTAVTSLSATDPDGAGISYAIVGGADASRFTIDGSTGALAFASAPDFENPVDTGHDNVYQVVVEASDGTFADSQALAVTVTNLNEAPVITSAGGGNSASISIAELSTAVTTVAASDPDGTSPVYSIAGGTDAARFTINATTGALSFSILPVALLPQDADGDNVYEVIVRASDGTLTDTQALSVQVLLLNFPPVITSNGGGASAAVNVAENSTAVTTVVANDPEGVTPGYAITGGADAALFTIDPSNGALRFTVAPDFESRLDANGDNVYVVVVTASDGPLSDSQTLSVTVTNVNEAPVNALPTGLATTEDQALAVPGLALADVDAGVASVQVVLAVGNGTITVNASVAGGVAAGGISGNGSGSVTLVGTVAAINATLSHATGVVYQPVTDFSGAVALTMTSNDLGNSGTGGARSAIDSVTIDVKPVTDVPVLVLGPAAGAEDSAIALTISPAIADVSNGGGQNERITHIVISGIPAGVTFANSADDTLTVSDGALVLTPAQLAGLSVTPAPDFNGSMSFAIDVTAQDGNATPATVSGSLAITVTPVNDAPVIASNGGGATAALTVPEGSTAVATVSAVDPDGSSPVYGIAGGADAARFTIDSATGALSFASAPDYETPTDADGDNVYDVIVEASDGALTDSQALSVTVTNTDEAPLISSNGGAASASVAVAEGSTAVTTVVASDPEGAVPIYSIAGGTDAAHFTIDPLSGALAFASAPDHETALDANGDNVYEVIVQASDGAQVASQALAVTVTNLNEAPVITSNGGGAAAALTVAEGTTAVTTVAGADPEGGALVYSIVGGADAARFSINPASGALSFVSAPDVNTPLDADADNIYQVTVQASDGALSDSQTLSVTVSNTNQPPVITSNGGTPTAALAIVEGSTAVTTVTAMDPDGATLGYAIVGGADAARFTIDPASGALTFSRAPDYESPLDADGDNIYQVLVQVSDGVFTASQALSVAVTNANEAPIIVSNGGGATAGVALVEGSTAVTTVMAIDPEGSAPVYSIAGGVDAARFTINPVTGALAFSSVPDYENPLDADGDNVYQVVVQASDDSLVDSQTLSITVTNADESPVIVSNGGGATAGVSVVEGNTAVTNVKATDPEGSARVYSIAGGVDAARFTINPITGALVFSSAPDYENPVDADGDNVYQVVVQASDGALVDSQALSITVSNANESPVIVSNGGGATAAMTVAEGNANVTVVAASDQDGGVPLYSIAGGADAARFVINPVSGALAFASPPDHERALDADGDNMYEVTVQASDGALVDSQALSISVTNTNESPDITSGAGAAAAAVSMGEGTTAVATIVAADPDGSAPVFSIAGGADAARFVIDPASGALVFTAAPDYERPLDADGDNVYEVIVRASDGALSDSQALSVNVNNINEAPTNVLPGALFTPAESMLFITGVSVTDVDANGLPIRVLLDVTSGTLTVSTGVVGGVSTANVSGNGSSSVTLIGTMAEINATLADAAGLLFRPTPGLTGLASLAMSTNDLGNTGAGGPASDSDVVGIEVLPSDRGGPLELETATDPVRREDPASDDTAPAPAADSSTLLRNEAPAGNDEASQPIDDPFASVAPLVQSSGLSDAGTGITVTGAQNERSAATRYANATAIASDRPMFARLDFGIPPLAPGQFAEATASSDFRRALDEVRRQLDERIATERGVVGMSTALAGSLTAGYVIWIVRGGVLLSTLVSSLPAWHLVDPLPVLNSRRSEEEQDDNDDQVERLFSNGPDKSAVGAAAPVREARWRSWLRLGGTR